nr:hypothetical protein Iba_chr03cCG5380 [Ipomoea batatas]
MGNRGTNRDIYFHIFIISLSRSDNKLKSSTFSFFDLASASQSASHRELPLDAAAATTRARAASSDGNDGNGGLRRATWRLFPLHYGLRVEHRGGMVTSAVLFRSAKRQRQRSTMTDLPSPWHLSLPLRSSGNIGNGDYGGNEELHTPFSPSHSNLQ